MRRLALSFAALLFLLVSTQAHAGRPRYADPRDFGLYAVGHTTIIATDPARNDRVLPTDIWYPADPDNAPGDFTFYDFHFFGLGITSDVAIDEAPISGDLGFPLIVFSHGSGGFSIQSTPLMEMLASHGFVVVAPNHTGNTAGDEIGGHSDPFETIAQNRPRDVSFLIDLMIARGLDPNDFFYGRVNPGRVGVAGHSFGGFTALAMASGYHVPSEGIAVEKDPRVRAIVPIAPASSFIDDADLASIQVPVLLLGGTLDTTTPIVEETTRPWALIPSRPFYRADVIGATHIHFANACAIGQALIDFGVKPVDVARLVPGYLDACGPGALPIEEAVRLQNFYVTTFFKRHLYNDPRYDSFLTPEYNAANEPGVVFFRKDKGQ